MRDSVILFDSHSREFTAWLKRLNNSTDAPGFGKMYSIIATSNKTHQGLSVLDERYPSDEDAKAAFYKFIAEHHDDICNRLGWLDEHPEYWI